MPSEVSARRPWEGADIAPPAESELDRLVGGTAHRSVARAVVDDAVLRANPELVAKHFGDPTAFPLEVQRVAIQGGREATLFTTQKPDVQPLVVLSDASGKALWTKRRPLAGTREHVRGLSLLAGPEGTVAIAWWDEPTHAVALRRWDFDGSVFADYHLFDSDACDALDAIYWPGHGWIVTVTAAAQGVARSQLLSEEGRGGFGEAVVEVTSSERVTSRASAAAGMDGIFHAYFGLPLGREPAVLRPMLWVTLRRPDGSAVWKAPVQLATMRPDFDPQTVPLVTLETPALLRVDVGGESYRVGSDGKPIYRKVP